MSNSSELAIQGKIAEIERLVREFKERFEAGTSDSNQFMPMNEIERLWGELNRSTNNIYSDVIKTLMASVSEADLVRKKKRI